MGKMNRLKIMGIMLVLLTTIIAAISTINPTLSSPTNQNHLREDEVKEVIERLGINGKGPWPEGYTGFEFEVIGYKDGYLIARIIAVHGTSDYNVGEIIYMKPPKIPN